MIPDESPYLETYLWRWLLFDSGLKRRRGRQIILQNAQSQALSIFWQAGPEVFVQHLGLNEDEQPRVKASLRQWSERVAQWEAQRAAGLHTVRVHEIGYPPTLVQHLPLDQRPLLLFLQGEPDLLELPLVFPLAETAQVPTEDAAWVLDTLMELAYEGALPLLVARPGVDAGWIKGLLASQAPFALVLPQGLAAYQPPPGLQEGMNAGRVLLISPFQPEWSPPASSSNPLLSHAVQFARALAHALLALTPPAEPPYLQQPCFLAPNAPVHPPYRPYPGPETFFLTLAELASAPSTPQTATTPSPEPSPEPESPPPTPEEILQTLARGGRIPEALARRLQQEAHQEDDIAPSC